ncbi:MAG: FAH family protein [Proteobacteria bacterium]|nr:FAH family protein [Pseudomonadota bacterium]
MIQSLVQFRKGGVRGLLALDERGAARHVGAADTTRALAQLALSRRSSLAALAAESGGEVVDLADLELLSPIDHPDPAHLIVSGTGLTHLGSAEGRDAMHSAIASGQATDSMKMFQMGLEGGKPESGRVGAQPEWFYKGDGTILVDPGSPLHAPAFAGDGGDEAEIAGVYMIDEAGGPARLGYVLGNEFSDHVTESVNYLWLAHSKLRQAAIGPELRLGELPQAVRGHSRIKRLGQTVWEKAFQSGESHMAHTIGNLEHHHFKYAQFRRPGDIHVHFFGAAALSFADGIEVRSGDEFEITSDAFHLPLRNRMVREDATAPPSVSPV